jgi:hypothetical protein
LSLLLLTLSCVTFIWCCTLVPLLPVVAWGLGCLVLGGIIILSIGHWILWMRASARVPTSPPSIGTGRGYWLVLTQNVHLAPNTQQAEQAGFTRAKNHKTCQSIFPEN